MSSIKKGVKRIFKRIKKTVKRYAKPALIIAGTLFTAGVAAGGFAAFGAVSAASGAAKIGAFMKAVGTTIGAGAQAIGGTLGLTKGISANTAAAMGNPALQGAGLFGGGAAASGASSMAGMGPLSNEAYAAATQARSGGFLGNVMGALRSFGSTDTGKMILAQGIMGGIQSYAAARQADKEQERFDSSAVFGVQRRGSGGQSLFSARLPDLANPSQQMPSSDPYRPADPTYTSPQSEWRGPQFGNMTPSPAPTQNPSPAWGGPQMMPIQGNYDMSYMFQNQNNNQGGNQLLPVIPPTYG